jgi:CheY-like chemotaxis protein
MTAESVNTIFEPFRQGNNSVVQKHGGLGIGLAMVKGLVEMHGGKVSVMSKGLGLGSEFTLNLPLDRKKNAVVKSTPPPAARPKSYRVLIIEDNVDSAETMRMLLELCGHVVCVAHTAAQGIDIAHEFHPQIAVCDIGLPGEMNGYGVAKVFRADKQLESTALIALTGYGQDADKHRALESGFDFHLTKPIDPDTISELLASIK